MVRRLKKLRKDSKKTIRMLSKYESWIKHEMPITSTLHGSNKTAYSLLNFLVKDRSRMVQNSFYIASEGRTYGDEHE
jgi:hypothetical protein